MTAPSPQPDLFGAPAGRSPLVRRDGHATSAAAAERLTPHLSALEAQILAAITAAGDAGLTDRELEVRPEFAHLAPSTARRRRTSLCFMVPPRVAALREQPSGKVVTRLGLTVWVAL